MGWENAADIGRLIAASHVALVGGLLALRTRAWERVCAIFLGLGGAAFLIFPLVNHPQSPRVILLLVVLLQSGASFWLWLFALIQLRDGFRPDWRHWLLLAGKLVLTIAWAAPRRAIVLPIPPEQELIWRALLPAALTAGFSVAAVVTAARRFDDDLLENRRSLRRMVIFYGGAAIAMLVGITLVLRGPVLGAIGDWLSIGMSLGACTSLHFWMAQNALQPETRDADRETIHSPELKRLAGRIETLFREEGYYRTEGSTVRELAGRLGEHEYKVRRAINGVLGYRNYNAFLNQARVVEAKRRLLEEPDLPVLRLAMDLGYRSLAVFNKAFKDATGRTPTGFRRAEKTD